MFCRGESLSVFSTAFLPSFGPETKVILAVQLYPFLQISDKYLLFGEGVKVAFQGRSECTQVMFAFSRGWIYFQVQISNCGFLQLLWKACGNG